MDTEPSECENELSITAILLFCCVIDEPELIRQVANLGLLLKAGVAYLLDKASSAFRFSSISLWIRCMGDS